MRRTQTCTESWMLQFLLRNEREERKTLSCEADWVKKGSYLGWRERQGNWTPRPRSDACSWCTPPDIVSEQQAWAWGNGLRLKQTELISTFTFMIDCTFRALLGLYYQKLCLRLKILKLLIFLNDTGQNGTRFVNVKKQFGGFETHRNMYSLIFYRWSFLYVFLLLCVCLSSRMVCCVTPHSELTFELGAESPRDFTDIMSWEDFFLMYNHIVCKIHNDLE